MLKLCEGDNLGVRYQLMHLYAYIEDEMHALALHKKYGDDEETQMLLPLAILYYKQNQFDKVVVKLFHDYKAFLTRAEGMNNIASVEQQDTRKHEEMIKGLLLDISL